LLKILGKLENYYTWIEKRIIVISSISITIVIFASVVSRYLLKSPMSWSQEVSIVFFMLLTYWSMSRAAKDETHYCVDVIRDRFKGKIRILHSIFIWLICLLISLLGVYFGSKMSLFTTMKTVSLRIPNSIILFSTMVMGFVGMSLRYLCKIINEIKTLKKI